jgi:hypothetical protein
MKRTLVLLGLLGALLLRAGDMQTRLYRFDGMTPEEVEAQVRRYVPLGPRVLVNPEVNQVMVIADADTHERVARLFELLDRPSHRVRFWFRHNRQNPQYLDLMDGDFANFPVTQRPLPRLERQARAMLPREWRESTLMGSVLEAHFSVLRADPPRVRIRLTPAVLFGDYPPYEVVRFSDMSTDLMMTDEAFVDLVDRLSDNEFYRVFFRSRGSTDDRHVPVGLLLSLEEVTSGR